MCAAAAAVATTSSSLLPLPLPPPKVHVAVVGSRSIKNYDQFKRVMDELNVAEKADLIVSGGAEGADTLAMRFAAEFHLKCLIMKPDWKRLGRAAGLARNTDIVANSAWVIAFWDGTSRGTADTIAKAKKQGKKLNIVRF